MRVGANLRLRQRANRKHGMRELLLREREQEVRLILVGIHAALEKGSSTVSLLDASIVTGGQIVGAESACPIEQRRELHVAVTVRTRNRSSSGRVLVDEVRDDRIAELPLEVD